ncbi:MAG: preprotein translocase subunit SecG, partial [Candidatus Omnitrophica bacterium]|nr:preprotein translocase subunit SecG [Candidatus Omnitrophota bacterium]
MYMFLLVIHVIVSLFLIFIILVQGGKGEGLSEMFGGGS